MSGLYILGALVALGLAVYLVWALFRPEDFS
ncbi:MAG TPA: K(+)-transporting ATPase subunit F [Burkholderiales bacterium]|jgi:K+-transporting ATPase KdpF subunit